MNFPDDHYVEAVRGASRLKPRDVRRSLTQQIAFLERKVEKAAVAGADMVLHPSVRDLRALIQALEVFDTIVEETVSSPDLYRAARDKLGRRMAR
jgi:hypothetical protein